MVETNTKHADSVLLDTSFLITLLDRTRTHHPTAVEYFCHWVDSGTTLYLSTVVVAEYAVMGLLPEVVTRHLRVLPFGYDHALETGALARIWAATKETNTKSEPPGNRDAVKDDIKLFAQAQVAGTGLLATDDTRMGRVVDILFSKRRNLHFKILPLWEPFDNGPS